MDIGTRYRLGGASCYWRLQLQANFAPCDAAVIAFFSWGEATPSHYNYVVLVHEPPAARWYFLAIEHAWWLAS